MNLPKFLQNAKRPNPRLEQVRDDLNRLKMLWLASTLSPIIYLVMSHFITELAFHDARRIGFYPLPTDKFQILIGGCAGATLVAQLVLALGKRRFGGAMRTGSSHPARLISLYRRRTYVLIVASEAPVLLGFLLFLVQGRPVTIFAFGIASLLFYAQSYPSETRLSILADRPDRSGASSDSVAAA